MAASSALWQHRRRRVSSDGQRGGYRPRGRGVEVEQEGEGEREEAPALWPDPKGRPCAHGAGTALRGRRWAAGQGPSSRRGGSAISMRGRAGGALGHKAAATRVKRNAAGAARARGRHGWRRSLHREQKFCQDDGTWRRELYKDSRGTQTSSEPTSRNLQSNQKSQAQQRIEVVKKLPVSDLRGKLSGVASQRPQLSSTVQVPKPVKEVIKSNKPVQKRVPPPSTAPLVIKKLSAPAPVPGPSALPKQSQDKVDASLDSLLKSLDLEKYLINFQAEEVDMKALVYMNEEDMKSLGIPMGPRKKILSAVAHRKSES